MDGIGCEPPERCMAIALDAACGFVDAEAKPVVPPRGSGNGRANGREIQSVCAVHAQTQHELHDRAHVVDIVNASEFGQRARQPDRPVRDAG